MILADKIINLRKKAGWSQEELAGRLGVTRQSVSKWEGAQSGSCDGCGKAGRSGNNIQAGDYGRGFRLYEDGKRKCPKEGSGNFFMGEFAYCTDFTGIYE